MTEKLCVIPYDGPIQELGGIRGPIVRPTKIQISVLITLINRGIPVMEVNPRNPKERIRLTFRNVNSQIFKMQAPAVAQPKKEDVIQELPKSGRNTVVAPFSEVAQVKKEKKEAKKSAETPVIKSNF